jgi:hypothetical protein
MNPVTSSTSSSNKGKGISPSNPLSTTSQNTVVPVITEVKINENDLTTWVNTLYDVTTFTDEDIKGFWEALAYKGFNRTEVLKELTALKDKRVVTELVIAGALRGPQAGSRLRLSNGKTCIEMGIPASGQKGQKALTLNKIVAATADLAAYYLKKMNAPKRMNLDLPGWLQFPSAGGIRLPGKYRDQHIEFSKRFSVLIGGTFQEQIYMQMEANSYLDEKLRLFE